MEITHQDADSPIAIHFVHNFYFFNFSFHYMLSCDRALEEKWGEKRTSESDFPEGNGKLD